MTWAFIHFIFSGSAASGNQQALHIPRCKHHTEHLEAMFTGQQRTLCHFYSNFLWVQGCQFTAELGVVSLFCTNVMLHRLCLQDNVNYKVTVQACNRGGVSAPFQGLFIFIPFSLIPRPKDVSSWSQEVLKHCV